MIEQMAGDLLKNPVVVSYVLTPLGIFGFMKILIPFQDSLKVKRGHFKVYFIKQNNRVVSKFLKPMGKQIKFKRKKLTFSDSPEYIFMENRTPCIYYDEMTGRQIKLKTPDRDKFDQTKVDNANVTSYELGFADGMRKARKDDNYTTLILILVAIAVLGIGFLVYNSMQWDPIIRSIPGHLDSLKAGITNLPKVIS